jgi:FtsH-binding integral membrane protein
MAAAIARVFARVSRYHASDARDFATLGLLIIFGLLGLVLTLMAARFGLDISQAFF